MLHNLIIEIWALRYLLAALVCFVAALCWSITLPAERSESDPDDNKNERGQVRFDPIAWHGRNCHCAGHR